MAHCWQYTVLLLCAMLGLWEPKAGATRSFEVQTALPAGISAGTGEAGRFQSSLLLPSDEPAEVDKAEKPTFLWPLPKDFTSGEAAVGVDRRLTLEVSGPAAKSKLLHEAFHRTRGLIFTHPPNRKQGLVEELGEGNHQGATISEVKLHVASADETLQLETSEAYQLAVPSDGSPVLIQAETVYGALHALQTLSQLCHYDWDAGTVRIRNVPWTISDSPRFPHRGLLIDTSRHFEPIVLLKRVIDSMTYAKLNVLHWHIVDEQAFPLEVPSFPGLWRGAYRPEERFTMGDAEELVEYARLRGVKVMAELDVPGHAASWGVGYPELWPAPNCTEPLDISNPFTFQLIDGILEDFARVFPYKLLHLGGDEVDTSCWQSTPHVKQWLEERGLSGHDAYAAFVLRAQEMAVARGWDPVNWEEPFDEFGERLHNRTIVHNWLGPGLAPKVVAAGYRCLVSNQDVWYLDHLNVPWDSFYANEPLAGISDPAQQRLVLGGEVCMWGETADPSNVLQTIWPRAAAAAERLWSPREATDGAIPAAVLERLEWFRCLLHRRSIPAAPLRNRYARSAPPFPGSCYEQ